LKLQNGVVGGALPGVVTAVLVQSVVSEVSEVDVISLVEIEVTCEVSEDITAVVVKVSIVVIIGNDGFVKLSVVVQSKI
jgi:hypothetical protein